MPTSQYTRKSNRQYLSRTAWQKHVTDYQASGLTQPEYAKAHGLVLTTFRNWIRRIAHEQQNTEQAFLPVSLNIHDTKELNVEEGLKQDIHVTLPNGIQCTFTSQHAPNLIMPWIEYLRVLP